MRAYIAIRLALDLTDDSKGAMAYEGISISNIHEMNVLIAHQSSPAHRTFRPRA